MVSAKGGVIQADLVCFRRVKQENVDGCETGGTGDSLWVRVLHFGREYGV